VPERLQLRVEQGEVGAVIEQQLRLAVGQRHEHLGEGQHPALGADRHAEVEPVALAGDVGRGDADLDRVPDVAVVGRLPFDHDHDVRQRSQQGKGLDREAHARQTGGAHRLRRRPAGAVEQPEALETVAGELRADEDGALGVQVADPGVVAAGNEGHPRGGVPHAVHPLPADIDGVAVAVAGPEHERWR
jgi:hypothetical protein